MAFPFTAAPSGGHPGLCWQAAQPASCSSTHLLLSDLPGRDVGAKLLQRVDDLAPRAHRDRTGEDSVQRVDAGILGKEDGGQVVSKEAAEGGSGQMG